MNHSNFQAGLMTEKIKKWKKEYQVKKGSESPSYSKEYSQMVENERIDFANEKQCAILIHILQKRVLSGSDKQIIKKTVENLAIFQKHKDILNFGTMSQNLFKKFRYEELDERKIIFNYGDIGLKYYIIIRGEVDLLIPKI